MTTSACVLCETGYCAVAEAADVSDAGASASWPADGVRVVWRDAQLRVIQIDDADYPGFCRVIWQAHRAEMSDLSAAARAHLQAVLLVVEQVVRTQMGCDKINLASLGNFVPHLHWHVIPRFKDDAHFPQAIWAARERQVPAVVQAARRARAAGLATALHAALNTATRPEAGSMATTPPATGSACPVLTPTSATSEGDHGRVG